MTHAVSLIAQGVFEKYPELTVILSGAGVTWLTTFLWRLDNDYVALRREVPWMTNLPSHYFRKHFRILTHPFDRAPTKEKLTKLLQTFRGVENLLCFSSGYPRWDTDRADDVASWLPANWHRQVFYDNPVEAFRWPTDEVEPEPPKESSAQGATGPPPGDGDR